MNGMARRFSALLDRHGGRLREWPDADLEAVRQFAARDPDARRELAAGQALERTLDALAAPAVTPASAPAAPGPAGSGRVGYPAGTGTAESLAQIAGLALAWCARGRFRNGIDGGVFAGRRDA